jgi:hypothetical protein
MDDVAARPVNAHAWEREEDDWYQEPRWCSERLFEEEPFEEDVWDPACGGGNIARSAFAFGHRTLASDLVDRGYPLMWRRRFDFLNEPVEGVVDNIVTNPPFKIAKPFALKALSLVRFKVAIIFPVARLNAAHWAMAAPLRRVWLLTPRPSMPPGQVIEGGEKPGGGKVDFCWLVFERGYQGAPALRWLKRDKA